MKTEQTNENIILLCYYVTGLYYIILNKIG